MKGIYLLLGTNLGDRLENLKKAAEILETHNVTIIDYSSVYESAPWGNENQPWFLNMVLRIDTILPPERLLESCLETEKLMGRERLAKWGERIIDVDILYYDNETIQTDSLTIPHPEIQNRRFTLMPLVEISPNEIHPSLGKINAELLQTCDDPLACNISEFDLIL